jgi:Ca2+-binding EF-hand superfamily protein
LSRYDRRYSHGARPDDRTDYGDHLRLVDLYNEGDTNDSNTVSWQEMHTLLVNHLGLDLSTHQTKTFLSMIDLDHDHEISFRELMVAVKRVDADRFSRSSEIL